MLAFECCECGCHGSLSERIGKTTFWIGRSNELRNGHGWSSPLIMECSTYERAVECATVMASDMIEEELFRLANIKKQILESVKPKKVLTFKQELLTQFPGKENKTLREIISECRNSSQILRLSNSSAITDSAKEKLKLVAAAFDSE